MPPHYKSKIGIKGVVDWAKAWRADVVIGGFEEDDDLSLFRKNGILVIAQDFKKKFTSVPNITADYIGTGRMAARFYIDRGFRNFAFVGFHNVCWSDERLDGYKREINESVHGATLYEYYMKDIDFHWFYERDSLSAWLKSLPKPIGIMACDDNQGSHLIEACQMARIKVPTEVSIIGVDNDDLLCNMTMPTLSSICIDIEDGGYKTAKLIEQLVENPDARYEDIVLKPIKIAERISTAAFATEDAEIQKAVRFIHQCCHRKISVNDVMHEVALSRRLLERRFKAVTGQSIYQYISNLKLKAFTEMLLDTNEQVINIALSLGENDTKSISKRFKQVYGCAPNEYREKHAK